MSIESVITDAVPTEKAYTSLHKKKAWQDITQGLKDWRIWWMLAYQDIKLRYRRSVLGPFWLTLSMAITVYSMGYLYSHLFHTDLQVYFPFLVSGMLSWALISTPIMELTDAFTISDGLIKQIKLPYTLHIHRIAARNIIIFFHNLLVIIPILIIFHKTARIDLNTLMLIPALTLIYFNSIVYGLILAMIGSRFRDISQVIKSLMNVVMYLTPILWNPILLPERARSLLMLNPFYAFVEMVRAPLIGAPSQLWSYAEAGLVSLIGVVICYFLFPKYRSRIIYWL